MTPIIPASKLAQQAEQVLSTHPDLPYRPAGRTLAGMDATGFIAYCLAPLGFKIRSHGSNSLLREIGANPIPLSEAMSRDLVVPGALLFRIEKDGREPAKFRNDGLGNATFALICLDGQWAAYPSNRKKKLIKTKIELVSGKANFLVQHPGLNYNLTPSLPNLGGTSRMKVIGDKRLNLRPSPSKNTRILQRLDPGTPVQVLEQRDDWVKILHQLPGNTPVGWVMLSFLAAV